MTPRDLEKLQRTADRVHHHLGVATRGVTGQEAMSLGQIEAAVRSAREYSISLQAELATIKGEEGP